MYTLRFLTGSKKAPLFKETCVLGFCLLDYDSRDGPVIAIGIVGAFWHDIRLKR